MKTLTDHADARRARVSLPCGTGLWIMAGLLLATLSPVEAGGIPFVPDIRQRNPVPLSVAYSVHCFQLECVDETGDGAGPRAEHRNADEPYAVMFVADISRTPARVLVATTEIFHSVQNGQSRFPDQRAWGIDSLAEPIRNPLLDVIILVAVMEHDDLDVDARVTWMGNAMTDTLARLRAAGWPRSAIVPALRETMYSILKVEPTLPRHRYDEVIGRPVELPLFPEDLDAARRGEDVIKSLDHVGAGGHYRTHFFLKVGP